LEPLKEPEMQQRKMDEEVLQEEDTREDTRDDADDHDHDALELCEPCNKEQQLVVVDQLEPEPESLLD
jgi:hypothetical protein